MLHKMQSGKKMNINNNNNSTFRLWNSLIDFQLCEMKIDESVRVLVQWQQVGDVLICHRSFRESIAAI